MALETLQKFWACAVQMSEHIIKLLLVEDNHALARLLETMLGRARTTTFKCQLVGSISEAVSVLPTGDFDAVLLDLELPDSRGLSSLERISRVRPDLPVVVLTAREEEDMALSALREGAQDYLIKGAVDRLHLVRALLYAIERKKSDDACSRVAALVQESRDLADRLRAVETENQVLRELLPLCAKCRTVQRDDGYLRTVEVYIQTQAGDDPAPGVCPGCAKVES